MKFKEYLINEKITKKEFDDVLKNTNIKGGAEFEFYLNEGSFNGLRIDGDLVDSLERKSDREIDNINSNFRAFEDEVAELYDEQTKLEDENSDLEDEINTLEDEIEELENDSISSIDEIEAKQDMINDRRDKQSDNEDRIKEIDDGVAIDQLQEQYEPYANVQDISIFFDIVDYLNENGIYIDTLRDDDYNQKLWEFYESGNDIPYTNELFGEFFGYYLNDFLNDSSGSGNFEITEDDIMNMGFPYNLNKPGWDAKEDGSLSEGGVEIVTPPLPLPELIDTIDNVFDWIDDYGYTDNSTGFHIHMSLLNGNEIDPLKLILFTEEEFIYNFFEERKGNTYAESIKSGHINQLEPFTHDNILKVAKREKLDKRMNTNKYLGLHLIDLDANHVEFRYMGGKDYHKKFKDIRQVTANYAYWLSLAVDPEYKRKEYLQKVNRLTNYFNKLYLINVIRDYEREVKEYYDGKYLKNWNKQSELIINPFKQKFNSIPTKVKNTNINNQKMLEHINDTVNGLFNKLLSKYGRTK